MRLFIGSFAKIKNFISIKKEFDDIIDAKWTNNSSVHLTYVFLGEVQDPKEIILKLKDIKYEKKIIKIKSLGFFGRPPKILFAKLEDKETINIYKNISRLINKDINKNFTPHITLARIKKVKSIKKFLQKIDSFKNEELGSLRLEPLLIKSDLTPNGPIYTIIEKF